MLKRAFFVPLLVPLFMTFLVPACGDDLASSETSVDAGSSDANTAADAGPSAIAVALGADFANSVGSVSTIEIPSLKTTNNVVAGAASSDAVIRVYGERIVIINRFGFDNVVILNRADFSLVEQISIGAGSNPQDATIANGKLYVATSTGPGVAIIDLANLSGGVSGNIDLSANDPDGNPNCASIVGVGDRLFVSCQLLDDNFSPRGPGIVAVIDSTTDQVVTTLTLTNPNPFSSLLPTSPTGAFGGDILVSTVPDFGDYTTGCIERISTGATPAVGACLVTNATINGYVSGLAESGNQLVVAVTTCQNNNCFDAMMPPTARALTIEGDGTPAAQGWMPSDAKPSDIAVCPSGEVLANDTNFAGTPGIRVYNSDGTERTTAPIDLGLSPAFFNGIVCY